MANAERLATSESLPFEDRFSIDAPPQPIFGSANMREFRIFPKDSERDPHMATLTELTDYTKGRYYLRFTTDMTQEDFVRLANEFRIMFHGQGKQTRLERAIQAHEYHWGIGGAPARLAEIKEKTRNEIVVLERKGDRFESTNLDLPRGLIDLDSIEAGVSEIGGLSDKAIQVKLPFCELKYEPKGFDITMPSNLWHANNIIELGNFSSDMLEEALFFLGKSDLPADIKEKFEPILREAIMHREQESNEIFHIEDLRDAERIRELPRYRIDTYAKGFGENHHGDTIETEDRENVYGEVIRTPEGRAIILNISDLVFTYGAFSRVVISYGRGEKVAQISSDALLRLMNLENKYNSRNTVRLFINDGAIKGEYLNVFNLGPIPETAPEHNYENVSLRFELDAPAIKGKNYDHMTGEGYDMEPERFVTMKFNVFSPLILE